MARARRSRRKAPSGSPAGAPSAEPGGEQEIRRLIAEQSREPPVDENRASEDEDEFDDGTPASPPARWTGTTSTTCRMVLAREPAGNGMTRPPTTMLKRRVLARNQVQKSLSQTARVPGRVPRATGPMTGLAGSVVAARVPWQSPLT